MKTTVNETLFWLGREYGMAGPETTNCERLLENFWMLILWLPLLVRTMVEPELVVLTVTEPKLTELGLAVTFAEAGCARRFPAKTKIKTTRHTRSFSRICVTSFRTVFLSGTRTGMRVRFGARRNFQVESK